MSGDRFFLPCKWQLGDGDDDNWKECNVNYSFNKDKMNRTHLIQNLKWLGKSNELIDLFGGSSNESSSPWRQRTGSSSQEMCEVNDEECNKDEEEGRLMGRGVAMVSFGRRTMWQSNDAALGERELRRALPEMNNTLSNWTLHGQNLGNMLRNYRQLYRHLRADQWKELGHFFNTASNVFDTIGSMTENAILRSVKYDDDDGGGGEGIRRGDIMAGGINNKPPVKLTPADANLSRYSTMFPSYQMDNGKVLQPNPTFGNTIFSVTTHPTPMLLN